LQALSERVAPAYKMAFRTAGAMAVYKQLFDGGNAI
jgi:hypothetical protein